jgi:hypothetical protein
MGASTPTIVAVVVPSRLVKLTRNGYFTILLTQKHRPDYGLAATTFVVFFIFSQHERRKPHRRRAQYATQARGMTVRVRLQRYAFDCRIWYNFVVMQVLKPLARKTY